MLRAGRSHLSNAAIERVWLKEKEDGKSVSACSVLQLLIFQTSLRDLNVLLLTIIDAICAQMRRCDAHCNEAEAVA